MKKSIFISIAIILVLAVANFAFAGFSSTATSADNTFTAGTHEMQISNDGSAYSNSVTATWKSPSNWAPGQSVDGTLHFTNIGTVDANHIYFMLNNISHTDGGSDGSNLMNAIFITNLQERFESTTTPNQAGTLASQVGNHSSPLTLAEFVGGANNWYGYYTYDNYNNNSVIAGGNAKDYDLIMEFTFDINAGNEYQGDGCSFNFVSQSQQNCDTDGLVCLHKIE